MVLVLVFDRPILAFEFLRESAFHAYREGELTIPDATNA